MGEWVEWTGGKCPVDCDAVVEVRFQSSFPGEDATSVEPAENFDWAWHYSDSGARSWWNIVAYRITKEPTN